MCVKKERVMYVSKGKGGEYVSKGRVCIKEGDMY